MLLAEALAVSRRVQGAAHPETLRNARGLALMYLGLGRGADLEELRALCHI